MLESYPPIPFSSHTIDLALFGFSSAHSCEMICTLCDLVAALFYRQRNKCERNNWMTFLLSLVEPLMQGLIYESGIMYGIMFKKYTAMPLQGEVSEFQPNQWHFCCFWHHSSPIYFENHRFDVPQKCL